MTVARPQPQILRALIAHGHAITAVPATAPAHLADLLKLQVELSAWKGGGTRFGEWLLLGALASLATAEGHDRGEVIDYLIIARHALNVTRARLARIEQARGRAS
jgi:hypothetical protein